MFILIMFHIIMHSDAFFKWLMISGRVQTWRATPLPSSLIHITLYVSISQYINTAVHQWRSWWAGWWVEEAMLHLGNFLNSFTKISNYAGQNFSKIGGWPTPSPLTQILATPMPYIDFYMWHTNDEILFYTVIYIIIIC